MGDLVTVVIPTYNRFKYLLNALISVKNQTYKNIEVIVVNDCSTDEQYYTCDLFLKKHFGENFYIVHLPRNSHTIFGKVAGGGNARNIGMMLAKGEFIAFLDDDDYFLPTKIERQMEEMKKNNCMVSCTEAYVGTGPCVPFKNYQVNHYMGKHWSFLLNKFRGVNQEELLLKMYENEVNLWDEHSLKHHNLTNGGSSIVFKKSLLEKVGYFSIRSFAEDYAFWKKLVQHSKIVFIREPLVYIDEGYGEGKHY